MKIISYILVGCLTVTISCTKKKAKPDLINHTIASKIEGKKFYGYGDSYQNNCAYGLNNVWNFYKSRDIDIFQSIGGIGVPSCTYNCSWSIIGDSLFIDNKIVLSNLTSPLYHFKIDELNDTLIKLQRKEKYNIGSYNAPKYKDSIFYLFLKTTKWQ